MVLKMIANRATAAWVFGLVATWGCVTLAQQGQVGQGFDNAGRVMKRGFQSAGNAVQGGFLKTRTSVHNMEVVSRVYSRLHWDKALTTSNLELEVTNGGIATLTGVVPDAEAKAKALALTSETVGVMQVVDQVVVTPPIPPIRPGAAPIVPGTPPTVIPPTADTPL